jgi:two-component system, NtrC family, sensor histidine kinase HydH
VLQFTREIEVHPSATDLPALIDQSIELAGERLSSPNIRCVIQGPRPMPVCVDPLLLGQAILNLLINAAEAVDGNGAIEISWSQLPSPNQLKLSIRDTGPGIPQAVLERIFNPFFTTKATGTGLGLAIVHRIIEAHDGVIAVTNPPSGGAMFEMKI